jgi:hypothetical protein
MPRRHDVAVGFRGKLAEREWVRELRAQAWTINRIVAELGVSESSVSVSVWVRDVEFDEATRAARGGSESVPRSTHPASTPPANDEAGPKSSG